MNLYHPWSNPENFVSRLRYQGAQEGHFRVFHGFSEFLKDFPNAFLRGWLHQGLVFIDREAIQLLTVRESTVTSSETAPPACVNGSRRRRVRMRRSNE